MVSALCVVAVAAAIVAIVVLCLPESGGKVVPPAAPATDKTSVNGEISPTPNRGVPSPQETVAALQLPYEGSNVFVRLPSGALVRQGESIPPPVEDKDEKAFRAAIDEWEATVKAISTGGRKVEYAKFAKALKRLPKGKRGENLKYAINLIDESNFMLIATLALDRDQPDELIALAFDACLNRDCASSRAVIEEISKDKSHPMYVDAARVMDIHRLSGRVGQ